MSMFIELTTGNGTKVMTVNINQIESVQPVKGSNSENALIGFNSKEGLFVKESYDEITNKLSLEGFFI